VRAETPPDALSVVQLYTNRTLPSRANPAFVPVDRVPRWLRAACAARRRKQNDVVPFVFNPQTDFIDEVFVTADEDVAALPAPAAESRWPESPLLRTRLAALECASAGDRELNELSEVLEDWMEATTSASKCPYRHVVQDNVQIAGIIFFNVVTDE